MSAPAELDYPNDNDVEAFYSDAPDGQTFAQPTAAQLVEFAGLERIEHHARILLERCWTILDEIPDGELTEDDAEWRDQMYGTWAVAWQELAAARRELGMAP